MTIANTAGGSGTLTESENIPVNGNGTSQYQFQIVCSYATTWASGAAIYVSWYNATGTLISSSSVITQTNMTGGVLYTINTGLITAPALSVYAVAQIELVGNPSSVNPLSVYQAEMDNIPTSLPVNINYAFTYTTWPWSSASAGVVLGWNSSPFLAGDTDSLVLDGQIELMGGGQGIPSTIPELLDSNGQGPTFRILAPPSLNSAAYGYESSYDLNAPQPTQDVVASMLLDGERPFGYRASNRTISLPVMIFGTQAGGMAQVLKAREMLMALIDQQYWQIKWTSADTGLPMLLDAFRALASAPVYGFNYSAGGSATGATIGRANYPIALVTLEIQALPYGRSDVDGVQNLTMANPIIGGVQSSGSSTIDGFATVFSPPPIINAPTWTSLNVSNPTTTSSFTIAYGVTMTSGSHTVVVQFQTSANNITGVTDTQGNPFTLASVQRNGSASQYNFVYTAPIVNGVGATDHVTITSSTTQNFQADLLAVSGAWTPLAASVSETGTATSYGANITGLSDYDQMFSVSFGAGSSGALPTGFNSIATPSGNGWNATISWFAQPINQTALTYNIASGLPNPSGVVVIPMQPTNRYWNWDTTTPPPGYVGHSAHYAAPRPIKTPYPAANFQQTLAVPASIVGCPVLSVWFGQSYDTQWPANPSFISNVNLQWTLIDNIGRSISFSTSSKKVTWGANPTAPKWTKINAAIPQGKAFSYNAITGYNVTITNWSASGHTGYVRMHCWLNDIVATPNTVQNQVSARGSLYNLFALPGSARSPISVQCQMPASANIVKEITTPATGTWVVPPGVYSVQAEAWGAGGAGSSTNLSRTIAAAGGGGGEFAEELALNVLPGTNVPWSIGAAGLPGQLTNTVVQFTTAGLAHWTCPVGVTTVLMEAWGGGGAGAAGGGGGGGGGYGSKQQAVTAGVTYYIWVGKGGKADTGTSSAQNDARIGGASYMASGPGLTYTASLCSASGGNTALTGGSSGGHGATNTSAPGTTHYPGGRGGNAPGPSGGGGGGAGGASGPGGVGGDSLPYVSSVGHWQQGGIAGTGTGQGGNGGPGANTPGFPGAGIQPGGGGGGGYQASPLYNASNPSNTKPGTQQTNYLGGNGGNGMVQFTYAIGSGSPVNGGNTTFGSTATTGTIVSAHGGQSAANNSALGVIGGTGSSNAIHSPGGAGGLLTSTSMASYMAAPSVTTMFSYLNSAAYSSTTHTTGVSGASVAQGTAVAVIESTAEVADLLVTDSAGNIYQLSGQSQAGSGGNGVTLYAYVANIEFSITTSTTLTVTSATSQEYGVLWMASPWLSGGVTSGNSGSGNGTGTAFSGTFGIADNQSVELELGILLSDGSTTVSSYGGSTKTWFPAASTSTLAAGSMSMSAYVMENQGGGNGVTGDVFSGVISGSANWATLCVPLTMINQQAALIPIDWRSGTTPGAQTTWATEAAISANGMIMVIGQCGSGSTITSGPSAMADASGNTYTFKKTQVISASGGALWVATAPVTHALAAGTTGTYNWGTASAAPEYTTATYWIPNAASVGLDTNGVTAVTGSSTTVAGSYTPADPNDMVIAAAGAVNTSALTFGAPAAPWNAIDNTTQSYVQNMVYAAQATDLTAVSISESLSSTSPWALLLIGVQMTLAGTGGGAAGGQGCVGYPGVWQFGGPGFAGGNSGKGGAGGFAPAGPGGGASLPGGGGGGAFGTSAGTQEGGQGAQGMVRLTWTPPLQPFNTLIVHSLGIGSNPNVNPCCTIPLTDSPNNTEYPIPSVNGIQPAAFSSTYTVILAAWAWNSSTASKARQITVTVNQYEYPGGPRYAVQASRAVTPSTDIINGLVNMGEVTLPVKDYTRYNDQSYFTVSINDTDLSDVFMDVLFLDTLGQTVLINVAPGNPGYGNYVNYFIDEATPDRDLGFVGASFQDRQHSVSVLDSAQIGGGPLYIGPGDNLFFVYSTQGAPNLAVNYNPRWYLDRTV
jgi:hypothetical protein